MRNVSFQNKAQPFPDYPLIPVVVRFCHYTPWGFWLAAQYLYACFLIYETGCWLYTELLQGCIEYIKLTDQQPAHRKCSKVCYYSKGGKNKENRTFILIIKPLPHLTFYFILYTWVLCLHVCLCTTCMDPLELMLQTVVSHHIGVGNQTWVLQTSS